MEFKGFKTTDAYYINDSIKEFIGRKVAGLRANISKELNRRLPQALINFTEGPVRKYIYSKVKRRPRKEWDNKSIPHLGESALTHYRVINQYASEYGFWFDAPHAWTHIGQLGSIATIRAKKKGWMRFKNRDNLDLPYVFAKVVNVPRRVSEDVIQDMFDDWMRDEVDDVVTAAAPKAM